MATKTANEDRQAIVARTLERLARHNYPPRHVGHIWLLPEDVPTAMAQGYVPVQEEEHQ